MTKLELLIRQIKRNPSNINSISYELSERVIDLFDKVMEYSIYYEIIKNIEFMDRFIVDSKCVIDVCKKYLSNIEGLSDQLTSQLSYIGATENNYIHDEAERLYNELGYIEIEELDNNYKLSFYNDEELKVSKDGYIRIDNHTELIFGQRVYQKSLDYLKPANSDCVSRDSKPNKMMNEIKDLRAFIHKNNLDLRDSHAIKSLNLYRKVGDPISIPKIPHDRQYIDSGVLGYGSHNECFIKTTKHNFRVIQTSNYILDMDMYMSHFRDLKI